MFLRYAGRTIQTGREPRLDDPWPTPARAGSVAMPRDGDPMSDAPGGFAPDLFHAGSTAYPARPSRASGEKPPRPPRPGQPTILLSARNERGGSVMLSFFRARDGIEFWRSLCPERSTLQHVASLPGEFTPGAVARLLASGAVRPAIDTKIAEDA